MTAPGAADPMQSPRASIIGDLRRLEGPAEVEARRRFLSAHPEASAFFELDFRLWALRPVEARWVGGFGAAAWVGGSELIGE